MKIRTWVESRWNLLSLHFSFCWSHNEKCWVHITSHYVLLISYYVIIVLLFSKIFFNLLSRSRHWYWILLGVKLWKIRYKMKKKYGGRQKKFIIIWFQANPPNFLSAKIIRYFIVFWPSLVISNFRTIMLSANFRNRTFTMMMMAEVMNMVHLRQEPCMS